MVDRGELLVRRSSRHSSRHSGSVLVDVEDPHLMKLRQLRNDHHQQRAEIDQEVEGVVFGVEAGQKESVGCRCRGELR